MAWHWPLSALGTGRFLFFQASYPGAACFFLNARLLRCPSQRAFEEEPQLSPADVSGGVSPSPEASPLLSALGATPPSDGFDFNLGPDFQNETAAATAVVAAEDDIDEVGVNVEADVPGGSTHPVGTPWLLLLLDDKGNSQSPI